MKKISLCTVCMNRGSHLVQTLPVNITENMDYPHVEFVVLDYNSKDNVGDWIKQALGDHIRSGLLKYYKTVEPEYFHSSHAKNMALKLGTGDIVSMVDADNYAGPGYAQWINDTFASHGRNTIITTLRKDSIPHRDQGGKFCLDREQFYAIGGLDEDLVGYGMEDTDLINRMENAGGRRIYIEDDKYLGAIKHSNEDRLRNFKFTHSLGKLYLRVFEPDPTITHLLYFFKDHTFSEVRYTFHDSLKNNQVRSFYGWVIEEDGLRQGVHRHLDADISLSFDDGEIVSCKATKTGIQISSDRRGQSTWKEIATEEDLYFTYSIGYTECLNRRRYENNDKNRHSINPNGWGKGMVYRNFDDAETFEVL